MITPSQATHAILAEVAAKHGTTIEILKSREGKYQLLPARIEAAARLHKERGLNKTAIGRVIGGRDHSTVCGWLNPDILIARRYATLMRSRGIIIPKKHNPVLWTAEKDEMITKLLATHTREQMAKVIGISTPALTYRINVLGIRLPGHVRSERARVAKQTYHRRMSNGRFAAAA